MKKSSIKQKKLAKECWSLDDTFLKWLHEHLKQYLKDASRMIDLSYHTFEINGATYTQEEAIKKMISNLEKIDPIKNSTKEYETLVDEILDIWKAVFHAMWW